jgi:NAD(P)-dependent dehydrogenase (short-subunit alcohol dehydrogenase family)
MSPTAVVTGSDSGIGRAVAVELARRGFDVGITWNTDEDGAQGTAREVRELGRRAAVRHLDLTRLPDAVDAVDELADELADEPAEEGADGDKGAGGQGRVDALVCCSGTGTSTRLLDLGFDDWREVVSVDLDGAFLCLQRAARRMVQQGDGGRVVLISSVHELQPRVGSGPYCAAKGGLGLLAKVAALELAEHGITVNTVAPGEISTPMTGQEDVDPHTQRRPGVPLGRPGDAREVAAVVGFLCSPEASYVTGATWPVDGGMLQMGPMAGSHLTSDDWRTP